MFGTKIANRTARGMAVGALILSISATTFGGSANAAPLADETQDCKVAAHARNDAVHLLHTAWKAFDGDLKDLARDARKLQRESEKASAVLTKDARNAVANARQELKDIASDAHEEIQAQVELGTACKEDEDASTTTTTTTTTTTSRTAPSDATAPADSTGSARAFDTSGLDSKYKKIVEDAIANMQGVVDDTTKAVMDMTTAAESKETTKTDADKVEQEVEKAKADRQTAKQDREDAKKADKTKVKSHNSGKGNGKDKAHVRDANDNEERD